MSVSDVRHVDLKHIKRWAKSPDGLGRLELRQYIIAVKHVDAEWPDVEKYRDLYDEGKIEMFMARDGYNCILYAKNRKIKAKRSPYFGATE